MSVLTPEGQDAAGRALLLNGTKWLGLAGTDGREIAGPGYKRVQLAADDWLWPQSAEKAFGPALKQPWKLTAVMLYAAYGADRPLAVLPLQPAVVVKPGQQFRYSLDAGNRR